MVYIINGLEEQSLENLLRFSSESKLTYQVFAASGFDDSVLPIELGGMLAFSAAGRPLTLGATFQMPLFAELRRFQPEAVR